MSVLSLLPKKAEILISNASENGTIGLDDILELANHIGDYHKTADSPGRKIVSYVLWRILLSYHARYDGEAMTAESSAALVSALQPTGKLLSYLQGTIELQPDEIIKLTDSIIALDSVVMRFLPI